MAHSNGHFPQHTSGFERGTLEHMMDMGAAIVQAAIDHPHLGLVPRVGFDESCAQPPYSRALREMFDSEPTDGILNDLYKVEPLDLPKHMQDLAAMEEIFRMLGYASDVRRMTKAVIDRINEVEARFSDYGKPGESAIEAARSRCAELEQLANCDSADESEYQKLREELDAAEQSIGELSTPLASLWKSIEHFGEADFKRALRAYRRRPTDGGLRGRN